MNAKKTTGYRYDLSWLTFAKALWNEKLLAVIISIGLASVLIIKVKRLEAVYRAEALILVDTQKIPERYVSSTVTTEVQDRLTVISQEILSSTRLKNIIDDFDLYPEQRKTQVLEDVLNIMRQDVDVKVEAAPGGSRPGAFRISYQGADPAIVAKVTNRIANLYIEENLRSREMQAEVTSEFIGIQLQEAQKKLDELEASVSRYKVSHNGELPQQENSLASTLGRLQAEMTGAQDSINRAEQTKIVLQNSLSAAEGTEAVLNRAVRPSASAKGVPAEAGEVVPPPRPISPVEQVKARLETLRLRYSDEHPEVAEVLRELNRAQIAEKQQPAIPNGNPQSRTARRPVPDPAEQAENTALTIQSKQAHERTSNLRSQITALDREIAARHADKQRIVREMNMYEGRVQRLPLREQEMSALTRDYDIAKNNYSSLLDKKIAAEMAGDLERRQKAERFTILDPARTPEKPAKPNRPVLYVMSIVGSLGVGIVIAMGKGLSHDRLLGEWELPKDVAILGRVPRIELGLTR